MGGVKLPILFSRKTKIKGLHKNNIVLENQGKRVFVGFGGVEGVESNAHTYIIIGDKGKIIFKGKAVIASGTSIRVDAGTCTFGENFSCNKNCFISCTESIEFGSHCLLGWNVTIRDSDGHTIKKDNLKKNPLKPVKIGNNVWIAANVDILKGVNIANGNVVGYRSCVTKSAIEENCLIGGYPARVLQRNIDWEK